MQPLFQDKFNQNPFICPGKIPELVFLPGIMIFPVMMSMILMPFLMLIGLMMSLFMFLPRRTRKKFLA